MFYDDDAEVFDGSTESNAEKTAEKMSAQELLNTELEDLRGPVTELDIMISDSLFRRRGLAQRSIQMLMGYGGRELFPENSGSGKTERPRLRVKILDHNTASIRLFEEKLGFKEVCRKAAFGEVWLDREMPC